MKRAAVISIVLLLLTMCILTSCGEENNTVEIPDDQFAIGLFFARFVNEQEPSVSSIKKIDYDDNKAYYKIEGTNHILDEDIEINIVVEFEKKMKSVKLYYTNSMNDTDEIKSMWNDGSSYEIKTFSEDELQPLLGVAKQLAEDFKAAGIR